MEEARRPARLAIGSSLALIAAVALLTGARVAAATTCELSSGVLDVSMTASGDGASVGVEPGGTGIEVIDEAGAAAACAGAAAPTVENTNAISIHNAPGLSDNAVEIREAGRFAPGLNSVGENGGSPEIEIFVNLNEAAGTSILAIHSTPGFDLIFGTDGVNPNFSQLETAPDADIVPSNVLQIAGAGSAGGDLLTAAGGAGTGAPMTETIFLDGGGGDDTLVGGEGNDGLEGGDGDDDISGRGGRDFALGGPGADQLLGGDGSDTLYGGTGDGGQVVNRLLGGAGDDVLRPGRATQQTFGGAGVDELNLATLDSGASVTLDDSQEIEILTGTSFADVLRGDGGPDVIAGLGGDDVLEGRGGADALSGNDGADTLEARDGIADVADCGNGSDAVVADPPGIDGILDCESALFPLAPVGGAVVPLPDTRAPRLGLRARPRQRVGGAIRVRVRSDEPCALALTGRVKPSGRRGGRLRSRRVRLGAGAARILRLRPTRTLARALRAARRGRVRLVATCVDAGGNVSRATARVRLSAR